MNPNRPRRLAARRRAPGNALIEFVLTLPIIFFMTGFTIYMSMAMLTKQQTLVEARYKLWHFSNGFYWSDMKLEGWQPIPGASDPDRGHRPRGTGEELDRLRADVEPNTIARTDNAEARDFWQRLWDNLPGRHKVLKQQSFQTKGKMWNFLDTTAQASHTRDSSTWHFHHLDVWRIARAGPLQNIFQAFYDNLMDPLQVPNAEDVFGPTRKDIFERWWHATESHWFHTIDGPTEYE